MLINALGVFRAFRCNLCPWEWAKDFHCNRARSIVLQFKTSKNTKKNIVSAMKEAVCVAFYFNRGIHCLVVEYQTME